MTSGRVASSSVQLSLAAGQSIGAAVKTLNQTREAKCREILERFRIFFSLLHWNEFEVKTNRLIRWKMKILNASDFGPSHRTTLNIPIGPEGRGLNWGFIGREDQQTGKLTGRAPANAVGVKKNEYPDAGRPYLVETFSMLFLHPAARCFNILKEDASCKFDTAIFHLNYLKWVFVLLAEVPKWRQLETSSFPDLCNVYMFNNCSLFVVIMKLFISPSWLDIPALTCGIKFSMLDMVFFVLQEYLERA